MSDHRITSHINCEKRIAELEAENERLRSLVAFEQGSSIAAALLRAELAALKAENARLRADIDYTSLDAAIVREERLEAELDALDVKYVTVQHELKQALSGHGHELLIEAGIIQQRRAEQAEAELAALKCCGNCKWFRAVEYQECGHPDVPYENYYISAPDKCDFTPSRWTPRS
jgi:hypothetical protein